MSASELLAELAALAMRHAPGDGVVTTALPHFALIRASAPTEPIQALHQPALCLIVQGAKQVMLGMEAFVYDPSSYLVISVDLPISGQVIRATAAEPYLCLRYDLDPRLLNEVILALGERAPAAETKASAGLFLSAVTPPLLEAFLRFARLLDAPEDQAILAPLLEREILYRALTGDQGARLTRIARPDSQHQRVSRAIGWIKENFRESLRVEHLAQEARMSPSALHHHFRLVTQMSPLQFQKHIRLQEARRLILAEAMDAAEAAFSVGYESPSQFSREYRRLFGAPPKRDTARLRETPALMAGA
ncbi:AraC family transcriptional regulator N-terminal domain-containing protein [Elstera sp.]|jgi:AraC-like DNA-binding protein|uniref:AraC family transcriptional regulator n=1 Tax=Elstera sp. TaxID=1916664 RepID=UPI0037BEF74D